MSVDEFPFGDLTVHRIGFGAAALVDSVDGAGLDRAADVALLRQAVEWGVDHIDIAVPPAPGVVHGVIREALSPYPDDLALVVVVGAVRGGRWPADPQQLRDDVLAHLRGLGAERLAAVHLRPPDPALEKPGPAFEKPGPAFEKPGPASDQSGLASERPGPDDDGKFGFDEQIDALAALRDEGLIAEIGLSHVSLDQLEYAAERVEITSVRNPFSVVDRSSESVLWACARQGIAFVPCHPLGSPVDGVNPVLRHPGVLAIVERRQVTAAQAVLAWHLEFAPNLLPSPGTRSLPRLREYLDAAALRLDRTDLAGLDAV